MTVECLKINEICFQGQELPAVPSLKIYQAVLFKARQSRKWMTQTTFAEEALENTHNFLGLLS